MTKLLFDIDNTLLDFDQSEYAALGRIFEAYQIPDTAENRAIYDRENKVLWLQLEQGKLSRENLIAQRFVRFFEVLELVGDFDGPAIDEAYQTYLSQGHQLMEHAQELLDHLSETDHQLYIVSNGLSRVSRPRIEASGILPYFSNVFISEEVGAQKPSLAFFEHVFDQIYFDSKDEFIIIGDSLTSDIQGGKNAGITSIWYNPKGQTSDQAITADVEISDLLDLLSVLTTK